MAATVSPSQRFTARNPCPICGGHANLPAGRGVRCYGFLGADGRYAHCTREDRAGGLDVEPGGTYAHRLAGECRCGETHGEEEPAPATIRRNGHAGRPPKPYRDFREAGAVAAYDYTDERGAVLFQVWRYALPDGRKTFKQARPVPGGWALGIAGVRRVPYRLPELRAADPSAWVLIPEGEKDADRLAALGFVATTNAMGAGKWLPEYGAFLRGRRTCLLLDNDADGEAHGAKTGAELFGVAADLRVLRLPGLPEKGDVSDWLDAGGTADELTRLIEGAPAWEPPAETKQTGASAPGSSEGVEHGGAVLDAVEAFIGRFVAYPAEHARVAHALWIAHAHCMDAWDSTPRLAFLSPEPASGKTRGLEVTEPLVPRPVEAVNVSAAYLFRKVDDPAGAPTILFDEVDTVFGPKAREHEEVRGLLNAGHRKGAVAGRCVVRGKAIETVEYPAYCAVALAGLGDLPDTILTRSVVIRMRRRSPRERVEPFRRRLVLAEGHALRDRLAAWVESVAARGGFAWPEMPAGVEDRDADVWEPLLAVAGAAGSAWPKRARAAAVAFVAEGKDSTPSLGVRLLADVRIVFGDRDTMATDAILAALHALDEAPWAEIVAGKPLNARGLARRLDKYGIKPRTVRAGDKTPRGYVREDLADAWARYLPPVADVADSTGDGDRHRDEPPSSPRAAATSATSATATERGAGEPASEEPGRQRLCADCRALLPDGWRGFYCARHVGWPDESADPFAGGEEGVL